MPKKELRFQRMVPLVKEHLRALNKVGWQKIPEADLDALATGQAKILAFLKTSACDLKQQTYMEYQATMDYASFIVNNMDEGSKLNLLEALGRPLTNDEMLRLFFNK